MSNQLGIRMYSSTTITAAVQQKQHVQHPTHRSTTHRPTMYSCATERTAGVLIQIVHAEEDCVACCCAVLGFPCLYDALTYRAAGRVPFDPSRMSRFSVGARSFAYKTLCRVGFGWRGRAAAGGRVAFGRAVPKQGVLKQT